MLRKKGTPKKTTIGGRKPPIAYNCVIINDANFHKLFKEKQNSKLYNEGRKAGIYNDDYGINDKIYHVCPFDPNTKLGRIDYGGGVYGYTYNLKTLTKSFYIEGDRRKAELHAKQIKKMLKSGTSPDKIIFPSLNLPEPIAYIPFRMEEFGELVHQLSTGNFSIPFPTRGIKRRRIEVPGIRGKYDLCDQGHYHGSLDK